MADGRNIAGVVLAGGQSSRMGQNKALLEFDGRTLLAHMTDLLRQLTGDVYVSGDFAGYDCIKDSKPFAGPVSAIRDVLNYFGGAYEGILFVPVDMPFLTKELLQQLAQYESGACYECWPLPLYLAAGKSLAEGQSVWQMVAAMGVRVLPLPQERQSCFANLNTPEEWEEAMRRCM